MGEGIFRVVKPGPPISVLFSEQLVQSLNGLNRQQTTNWKEDKDDEHRNVKKLAEERLTGVSALHKVVCVLVIFRQRYGHFSRRKKQ